MSQELDGRAAQIKGCYEASVDASNRNGNETDKIQQGPFVRFVQASPVVALLAIFGCGEAPPISQDVVPVISSDAQIWDAATAWRVDPIPTLVIGVEDGNAAQEFYRVRSVIRLADGTFVVGDASSGELRFFDNDGQFLFAAGGRGSGPGEFAEFSSLRMCRNGDRIIVEDNGADRFHLFETSGDLVETVAISSEAGRPPNIIGCFADGSLLAVSGGGALRGNPGDVIELTTTYHRYSDHGVYANAIATVASRPRYVNEVGGRRQYPFIPLTASPEVAAGSDAMFLSYGGGAVVWMYDLAGSPIAEYRWNPDGRARVSDVWREYTEESLGHMGQEDLQMYRHFYSLELPLPEYIPVVNGLNVDPEGNVWVERVTPPGRSHRTWTVLSSEGVHFGDVDFPPDVAVLEIGLDYVIGLHIDELNVERIHVYSLLKPRTDM